MTQAEYEKLRAECIKKFKLLYKDELVFDICKVDKSTRIRLFDDEIYVRETKAIKAELFAQQLEVLDGVMSGSYTTDNTKDQSGTVLKALEIQIRLLSQDVNETKNESNALNVAFASMSLDEFNSLSTVEVNEGSNSDKLSADFGVTEDNDSFEARLKSNLKERMDNISEEE